MRPERAYYQQRWNAQQRGIGWEFTFDSWWRVWNDSGKWALRGRGNGYMMCRYGDVGPYAPENVYIAPGYVNVSDRKTSGLPIGVSPTPAGHFRTARYIDGRLCYLGTFKTADLAAAAYIAAGPNQ